MGDHIGWAVYKLLAGCQVRRRGWDGKGMWLSIEEPGFHTSMTRPYVYMNTADNQLVPWTCSQNDLLAQDWELAE